MITISLPSWVAWTFIVCCVAVMLSLTYLLLHMILRSVPLKRDYWAFTAWLHIKFNRDKVDRQIGDWCRAYIAELGARDLEVCVRQVAHIFDVPEPVALGVLAKRPTPAVPEKIDRDAEIALAKQIVRKFRDNPADGFRAAADLLPTLTENNASGVLEWSNTLLRLNYGGDNSDTDKKVLRLFATGNPTFDTDFRAAVNKLPSALLFCTGETLKVDGMVFVVEHGLTDDNHPAVRWKLRLLAEIAGTISATGYTTQAERVLKKVN